MADDVLVFDDDQGDGFTVESWMDAIGHLTIHRDAGAACVPLSTDAMKFLCAAHECWMDWDFENVTDRMIWHDDAIQPFAANVVAAFQAGWTMFGAETEYFIRLNAQSPRDTPGGNRPILTARGLINQLIKSRSTHANLMHALQHNEPCRVWIFPWRHELWPERELRCFVWNRRITAISQRHTHLDWAFGSVVAAYLPFDELCELLYSVSRVWSPPAPERGFVMDVYVDLNMDDDAWVVKLSPWRATSGVLFDWDADADVLEADTGPTLVRWMHNGKKGETEV